MNIDFGLLAALTRAIHAGKVVEVEYLVAEFWRQHPPDRAVGPGGQRPPLAFARIRPAAAALCRFCADADHPC